MSNSPHIIFIIGMPGAGKTYFGRLAANELNLEFHDLDEIICKEENKLISEIFESLGETEFRRIESEVLINTTLQCKSDSIIVCGGGTACFNNNMAWMNQKGTTVWIDCPLEEIENNISQDPGQRPLFNTNSGSSLKDRINAIYAERQIFYAQSQVKLNVHKGLSPYLFTKQLHLSTFVRNN